MAWFLVQLLKKTLFVVLACIFTLGGIVVGAITGAITGQTMETGFVHGAGIGIVAGGVVAIELVESLIRGEFLSKMHIFRSLINGNIFKEWVSPAMLKAYEWPIGAFETSYILGSETCDLDATKGLSMNYIKNLPHFKFFSNKSTNQCNDQTSCSICLQDFHKGDIARRLPKCRHFYHLTCIDEWLEIQGSCPMCRADVSF